MNVVEASGLGKRYGRTWALRECTLEIPAGRVTALVGPNGAGKSTLLNLAVGLTAPMTPQSPATRKARLPGWFSAAPPDASRPADRHGATRTAFLPSGRRPSEPRCSPADRSLCPGPAG